jgi:hypothetical protein
VVVETANCQKGFPQGLDDEISHSHKANSKLIAPKAKNSTIKTRHQSRTDSTITTDRSGSLGLMAGFDK